MDVKIYVKYFKKFSGSKQISTLRRNKSLTHKELFPIYEKDRNTSIEKLTKNKSWKFTKEEMKMIYNSRIHCLTSLIMKNAN